MANHKFKATLCILSVLLASGQGSIRQKRFLINDLDLAKLFDDVVGPDTMSGQTTSNHVMNFSMIFGYLIGGTYDACSL